MIEQRLPAQLEDFQLHGNISTYNLNSQINTPTMASDLSTPAINSEISIPDRLLGETGKSAYELAVEAGYKGTMEEWLQSLVGPPGPDGEKGQTGDPGVGIASFEKVEEHEDRDTYQFILTDGTSFTFDIPRGKNAVADHATLINREEKDQHPIEAISGLDEFTNLEILNLWNSIMED